MELNNMNEICGERAKELGVKKGKGEGGVVGLVHPLIFFD